MCFVLSPISGFNDSFLTSTSLFHSNKQQALPSSRRPYLPRPAACGQRVGHCHPQRRSSSCRVKQIGHNKLHRNWNTRGRKMSNLRALILQGYSESKHQFVGRELRMQRRAEALPLLLRGFYRARLSLYWHCSAWERESPQGCLIVALWYLKGAYRKDGLRL